MREEEVYGVLGRRERWIRLELWMILGFIGLHYILPDLVHVSRFGSVGIQPPQLPDIAWYLGLTIPFLWILWVSGDDPSMFGFIWPRTKEILTWALILVVVVALERAYFLNRLDWFGFQPSEQKNVLITLVSLFALTIVPAAYEEILMRGLLQTRLTEIYGKSLSVGGSSVVFALAHISYGTNGVFFALIMGLVFGIGRANGVSLLTLSLAHAVWNTGIYYFWKSVVPAHPAGF